MPIDPERVLPRLRQAIDGEYGGLRIEVTDVNGDSQVMHVNTKIYDENGTEVGHANRSYSNGDHLIADHTKFWLEKHVRGQGCANEFNKAMFDWYKQSGVDEVRLRANIDVGSYAWARQDFDFANPQQAVEKIRPRLRKEIVNARREVEQLGRERDSLPEGPDKKALSDRIDGLKSAIDDAEDLREGFYVGSPDFPTPKQIADLGRPPGLLPEQSRDLSWLGKRVFMEPGVKNIYWHGVKIFE